jgi:hypothetical protein
MDYVIFARIIRHVAYKCVDCGSMNILTHRLTSYRDTETILSWTQSKLAMMLQTDRRYISATWSLGPTFSYWSKTRHSAVVWTLGHMMHYSIARLTGCRPIELFIHTHTHTYMYTYMYTYIHTHTHTIIHTYIHNTYVHTYIHVYIKTYIH